MKKGEISRDRITAVTQYVDKGDHQYRTEIYILKKKKVVRGKRRFFKCPLCELVTAYLPTYFANKHKIPHSSAQSERYMALACAYKGGEELKYIERTRPCRPTVRNKLALRLCAMMPKLRYELTKVLKRKSKRSENRQNKNC